MSTVLPFRSALSLALIKLISAQAVPVMNADIALREVVLPGTATPVQFGLPVLGDLRGVEQATICIIASGRDTTMIANDLYNAMFGTRIVLKTPFAGDGDPEDFEQVWNIFTDTMHDLLTSKPALNITPTRQDGGSMIAGGGSFRNCWASGDRRLTYPVKSAEGVQRYFGGEIAHTAQISYSLNRPVYVGM